MSTKFIIAPKSFPSPSPELLFIPHTHPKSPKQSILLALSHSSQDKSLYFIQKTAERPQSWIIRDYVIEDGTCYFLSAFDSMYLWIPTLRAACEKKGAFYFVTQRDLLNALDDLDKDLRLYLESEWQDAAERFCEDTLFGEDTLYKFSVDKTMQWLQKKLDVLREGLRDVESVMSEIRKECGALAQESDVEQKLLLTSLQMLGDFVAEENMLPLVTKYNLQAAIFPHLFVDDVSNNFGTTNKVSTKKRSRDTDESPPKQPEKKKVRAESRASKKVDATKFRSLTSFFKKKEDAPKE